MWEQMKLHLSFRPRSSMRILARQCRLKGWGLSSLCKTIGFYGSFLACNKEESFPLYLNWKENTRDNGGLHELSVFFFFEVTISHRSNWDLLLWPLDFALTTWMQISLCSAVVNRTRWLYSCLEITFDLWERSCKWCENTPKRGFVWNSGPGSFSVVLLPCPLGMRFTLWTCGSGHWREHC